MFRKFASLSGVGAQNLFLFHPTDLIAVLELAWDRRPDETASDLGRPTHRSDLNRFGNTWFGSQAFAAPVPVPTDTRQPNLNPIVSTLRNSDRDPNMLWDHLIYAYMIENTRASRHLSARRPRIRARREGSARRVVRRSTGCGAPRSCSIATRRRFSSRAITRAHVRPDHGSDPRATATTACSGMDLNHGAADNKPYSYVRAEAANKEFVSTFEELLREVWIGIINACNISGSKGDR